MSKINALVVKQWIEDEWDKIVTDDDLRRKPEPHFYVFSVNAITLKRLTGVYRRDPNLAPAKDSSVQRRHMPERSKEILRYIIEGFPLSKFDKDRLVEPGEANDLRMPGWLPTAVIINILTENDTVGATLQKVGAADLVKVNYTSPGPLAEIEIPDSVASADWAPEVYPLEVIDGQHRLWAFEDVDPKIAAKIQNLEIPVIAFWGLSPTWKAYIFYTVNQLAKRIDSSLVFDLYPLLRTQDWLLRFEGPNIYRQTRAQDLVMILWEHPESPWKDRINRLGGRVKGQVTQASFINSLMASVIKGFDSVKIGGLFGSLRGTHSTVLPWSREMQAAFLIIIWQKMKNAVGRTTSEWAAYLKRHDDPSVRDVFAGSGTLLATDQGVRGLLQVVNDLFWLAVEIGFKDGEDATKQLDLGWNWIPTDEMDEENSISDAIADASEKLSDAVLMAEELCETLATFDWRLTSVLDANSPAYVMQSRYRGSSGYKDIRNNLLKHAQLSETIRIKELATAALAIHVKDVGGGE